MENKLEDKKTDTLLDKMEEIFGVRELEFKINFFELKIKKLFYPTKQIDLFIKVLVNGKEESFPIEGERFEEDYSILTKIKDIMDRLEIEYKNITKNENEIKIDEWKDTILNRLTELGVKYSSEDFIIELERINRNFLLLDDFVIFERVKKPYNVRIFSYEDLGLIFKMVEKDQRKINLLKLYGK